jgi:predicted MFS family arabinose efflux permease
VILTNPLFSLSLSLPLSHSLSLSRDFFVMLTNPDFVLLLVAFSIEAGISWALPSILGQLVQPCGYSNSLVGKVLLVTAFAGATGSFFLALILRSFPHHYFQIVKVVIIVTAVACMICFGANKPGGGLFVLLAWTFYGFVMVRIRDRARVRVRDNVSVRVRIRDRVSIHC